MRTVPTAYSFWHCAWAWLTLPFPVNINISCLVSQPVFPVHTKNRQATLLTAWLSLTRSQTIPKVRKNSCSKVAVWEKDKNLLAQLFLWERALLAQKQPLLQGILWLVYICVWIHGALCIYICFVSKWAETLCSVLCTMFALSLITSSPQFKETLALATNSQGTRSDLNSISWNIGQISVLSALWLGHNRRRTKMEWKKKEGKNKPQ